MISDTLLFIDLLQSVFITLQTLSQTGLDDGARIFQDAARFVVARPDIFVTFVLWQLALLYAVPVLFWDFELGVFWLRNWQNRHGRDADVEWGLDAVQVRIVTIDNADVVQQTVDALPDAVEDVVVIAEREIEVAGATVLAVPPAFECAATHKGRAVEWARRHHPTDREYVLYMDEDTDATDLSGIPSNADIVQFRERPSRSGGILPYLAEIHRIGFNVEQRSFPFFRLPFYAWGGGIAVRSSLEEQVTWDTRTIVEDSVFAWRAVLERDATVDVVDVYLSNQAPPSVWAMIKQRRRWLTGTRQQRGLLPPQYQLMYQIRDLGWALSTFGPILWLLSGLSYVGLIEVPLQPVFFPEAYTALTVGLLAHVYVWSVVGVLTYRPGLVVSVLLLAFTPVVVTIHSIGALYGLVRPAQGFAVTRKVVRGGREGGATPPQRGEDETAFTCSDGDAEPAEPSDRAPASGSRSAPATERTVTESESP
jgi:hypothetical protein